MEIILVYTYVFLFTTPYVFLFTIGCVFLFTISKDTLLDFIQSSNIHNESEEGFFIFTCIAGLIKIQIG